MRYLLIIVVLAAMIGSASVTAQIVEDPQHEQQRYALDTLVRKSEWWLGFNTSAFYGIGFGTLTTDIIGGTSPESPAFTVEMQGGETFGIGIGPSLEYRPIYSDWGFILNMGLEWRWSKAESSVPIAQDIFATNATFENQTTAIYFTGGLSAKYQIGVTGGFVMGGLTFGLPINTVESFIWQHEKWEGESPTNEPGAPQTSIKFKTDIGLQPRVGLQIGVGHDFMVGWFGYRGQMLTPYLVIEGGTPSVMQPTAWNTVHLRLGAIWRAGL